MISPSPDHIAGPPESTRLTYRTTIEETPRLSEATKYALFLSLEIVLQPNFTKLHFLQPNFTKFDFLATAPIFRLTLIADGNEQATMTYKAGLIHGQGILAAVTSPGPHFLATGLRASEKVKSDIPGFTNYLCQSRIYAGAHQDR